MRQSSLFSTTRRETPHDEESKNAILLWRGGYIDKTTAGVYSFLPLGLRVIQKIQAIVRDELNKLPRTQEILMSAMQPRELWQETGRWDDEGMKTIMYRVEDSNVGLGPTHEENVTDLFRKIFTSYKDLPISAYQIQTKFRKELRPKSGLLRGREFQMKDMYSFHTSVEDLKDYYEQAAAAYLRIFQRMGLDAVRTEASGGVFSKQHSDEYQVINDEGEDTIYLNADGSLAWNKEVVDGPDDPRLVEWGGGQVRAVTATEVGNIFQLGTKFTDSMAAQVVGENGEKLPVYMGCYGIGISRVMGVIAELKGDIAGKITWPESIAPFKLHLIDLTPDKQGEAVYQKLLSQGEEVLYDDRDRSAGEKFADADLVGSPVRMVISKRSIDAGGVEVTKNGQSEIVPL